MYCYFQSKLRGAEKGKKPIKHIVIYLRSDTPTMPSQLKPEEIYHGFDLLYVRTLDTGKLLSSHIPEVVLVAILANYTRDEAEKVIFKIIQYLKKLINNKRF